MKTKEVMNRVGAKDRRTVVSLFSSGRIPAVKLSKEWRADSDAVEAFMRGEDLRPKAQAVKKRLEAKAVVSELLTGVERIITR